uniref:glutathione transferase n=1 Tax=Kalanchoe fedtschenkoi TaxID=63787 RepID=A0A7N0VL62_KALFE
MSESGVKLFQTWSSPLALRVVSALKLKGVKYETILEDLANKIPSLLQYNPIHKKVPVLVHGGNTMVESLVILEYIDEPWAVGYRLLPEDPYERSVTRFWAKFGDDRVFVSVWRAFFKEGKEQEEALLLALNNLRFVEEHIKRKRFFRGDEIGFIDLIFGCVANLLSILEEVAKVKILDPQTFPLLLAWIEVFSEVPVVKENWPPREKMIVKFKAIREYYLASN